MQLGETKLKTQNSLENFINENFDQKFSIVSLISNTFHIIAQKNVNWAVSVSKIRISIQNRFFHTIWYRDTKIPNFEHRAV